MEAIGKFDFSATADDELSFKKDDVIKILGTKDNWFQAERYGRKGFVPRNYITLDVPSWFQEDMSRRAAENTLMPQPTGAFIIRGSQSSPGNFSISVRHDMDVQHFKVLQDSGGHYFLWAEKFSSLNELVDYYTVNSISKQSIVRLLSEQQSHMNAAADHRPLPQERRHKIEELQSRPLPCPTETLPHPQERRHQSRPSGPPGPPPRPAETLPPQQATLMKVKALFDFRAEEQDELNFSAGDVIDVVDQSEAFWWVGRLRGRTGLFPTNYITPL